MGESEFILDGMTVGDALAMIDKLRREPHPTEARTMPKIGRSSQSSMPVRESPGVREAARTAPLPAKQGRPEPQTVKDGTLNEPNGAETIPSAPANPKVELEPAASETVGGFRAGIVVGNATGTLFEQNPYQDVPSLDALAKLIEDCTRCKLYLTAKCAVPGDGNADADFMCVGEAPGANEDETGHAFVGQAGALLTKILAAINLGRDQVFITNVLKHRPPANRNPQPNEVEACTPFLVRQIQLVKPKVILALGTFAAQTLLNTRTPIDKLRGAVHRYYGIPLIVTYHPAALLRNPAWKRPTWEDVKLARLVLDSAKS
jgi:DNA polymerase